MLTDRKGRRESETKHQGNKNFSSNLQGAKPSNIIFNNNHKRDFQAISLPQLS